jgi:hypothetical protein
VSPVGTRAARRLVGSASPSDEQCDNKGGGIVCGVFTNDESEMMQPGGQSVDQH